MKVGQSLGALALAGLLGCTPAESQGGLTLESKLPVSFTQLSNVVELSGGRVAFADTRDKLFLAANLATGKVDTLGTRVDSIGPDSPAAQYKFPGWIAHLAGDTVVFLFELPQPGRTIIHVSKSTTDRVRDSTSANGRTSDARILME